MRARASSIPSPFALHAELEDSGVTVSCLTPGATEIDYFERADMVDVRIGTEKDDPVDVAAVWLQGDDEARR